MTKKTTKKTGQKVPKKDNKNRERLKTAEYLAFIEFVGTPVFQRELATQGDFAKKYKVNQGTLSTWKKRPDFWEKVEKHRQRWGQERTSNLLGAFYSKMIKYDKPFGKDLMVWLQYIEGFSPKTKFEDVTPPREITPEQEKAIKEALTNIGLASIVKDNEDRSE